MVVRISDKKKNYSKVTKLLVKPLFIINEVRSILENLIESGVKVPKILSKGLTVYEKKIEGMVE